MKIFAAFVSMVALAIVIVPVLMYLGDAIDKPRMQMLMLAGTALWFVTAPLWMGRART